MDDANRRVRLRLIGELTGRLSDYELHETPIGTNGRGRGHRGARARGAQGT